jgi:hypothetical protein
VTNVGMTSESLMGFPRDLMQGEKEPEWIKTDHILEFVLIVIKSFKKWVKI